jgi:hypothetical protein
MYFLLHKFLQGIKKPPLLSAAAVWVEVAMASHVITNKPPIAKRLIGNLFVITSE